VGWLSEIWLLEGVIISLETTGKEKAIANPRDARAMLDKARFDNLKIVMA
jgi:hypothetical protein